MLDWSTNEADIFAIVIFICDNLLMITENEEGTTKDEVQEGEAERIQRFLRIAILLPMELQMLLMNRTQGSSSSDFIPLSDREIAFKNLALTFAFD